MKCNWCGKGEGKNYTTDKKTRIIYYYYCQDCVGDYRHCFLKDSHRKILPRTGRRGVMTKRKSEYHVIVEALKYYQKSFSPCTYTHRTCEQLIECYKKREQEEEE